MKKYFYNVFQSLIILIIFSIESFQQEAAVISEHIKKAAEVYDFATQIMNLGGSIIGEKEYPINNGFGKTFKIKENSLNQRFGATPTGLPYSEYGGGPLGAARSRSQPKSLVESMMETFLGASPSYTDHNSNNDPYDLGYGTSLYSTGYGNNRKSEGPNSNIEGILRALVRNGAKKAEMVEPDGTTSFLSQFFGKRKNNI
ncbi:hypothetical protein Mgra_00002091 [Meloidogyne graminicola]|uniref:Uncharacterized protein n=1 Tax=Meloidogyne graminicola TaxID=189291 RepID=A0A8S9ZZU7_9BILA|nr:hypothetical protein Mgra_00002091 [Meloidogyne graminicola]